MVSGGRSVLRTLCLMHRLSSLFRLLGVQCVCCTDCVQTFWWTELDKPARLRFCIQIQYLSMSTKITTNTEMAMLSRQSVWCKDGLVYSVSGAKMVNRLSSGQSV